MRGISTVLEFLKISGCEKEKKIRDGSSLVTRISKLSSSYSENIFWKKKNELKTVETLSHAAFHTLLF